MAAPSNELEHRTRCRALVGGLGVPGLRDLDFGRSFVAYSENLDWPEGVVVEEIPASALLVLHRLQELRPDKLVIVAAISRRPDEPGSVRRYQLVDQPTQVHDHAADAATSGFHLHHSLALARQWGALPETVVVEVEPAETTLGLGFSEAVGAGIERILALVREELAVDRCAEDLGSAQSAGDDGHEDAPQLLQTDAPQHRADDLAHDWDAPSEPGRLLAWRGSSVRFDQLPDVDGLMLSVRSHPGDPERRSGGDWCDIVSLGDGWTQVLVGEVLGQGLDSVAAITELRTAARACGPPGGRNPGQVLARLDRVVEAAGLGESATALCLAIHAPTGEVRMANAGHCPPVLCAPDSAATLCEDGVSGPLGASRRSARAEAELSFPPDSTLLLLTYGVADRPHRPMRDRMAKLLVLTGTAPGDPEGLCDHVAMSAQATLPPGEGGCLLAIRRSS